MDFTGRTGNAPLAAAPPAAAPPPALSPPSPPAPPSAPERDGMTCRLRHSQQRLTACCPGSASDGQQGCAAGAAPLVPWGSLADLPCLVHEGQVQCEGGHVSRRQCQRIDSRLPPDKPATSRPSSWNLVCIPHARAEAPAAGAGPAAAAGHGRVGPRGAAAGSVAAVRRRGRRVAARVRAERRAGAVGGEQRRADARAAPRRGRAVRAVAAAVVGRLRARRHGCLRQGKQGAGAPCPRLAVAATSMPRAHEPASLRPLHPQPVTSQGRLQPRAGAAGTRARCRGEAQSGRANCASPICMED